MIKLYQFTPVWGLLNPSPPCMKVEVYLRLAEIPYETDTTGDPRKGPKGKLPFIEDDGEVIADSHFCIAHLKMRYQVSLDDRLTPEQQGQAFALSRMLDEHYYWIMVYSRWIDEASWPLMKKDLLANLPWPLSVFGPPMFRRQARAQLHGQGLGRHSQEEVYGLGIEAIDQLSGFLGDKDFCFGEQATSADAALYAHLASTLQVPFTTPLQTAAKKLTNLTDYCERMAERIGVAS